MKTNRKLNPAELKEEIVALARKNWVDLVSVAPASRFDREDPVFRIMPEVRSVICFGYGLLRGAFRGIEEGTTFYQYTSMAVENMEENIMPMAQLLVANLIEDQGYTALPQRRHQVIMSEENSTNPEVAYNAIMRSVRNEPQMNFPDAAVTCGLGEKGFHGAVLTEEFGPLVRYNFLLTDAVLPYDEVRKPRLCDGCKRCAAGCPGHAIDETGKTDPWRCAVYYNGACGLRNPFMSPDAYEDFENRMEIIEGNAEVTPESARKIIDSTYFYPPIKHYYRSSICARACDLECYIHLEEKGLLKNPAKRPFRRREPWSFDTSDFEPKQ